MIQLDYPEPGTGGRRVTRHTGPRTGARDGLLWAPTSLNAMTADGQLASARVGYFLGTGTVGNPSMDKLAAIFRAVRAKLQVNLSAHSGAV